MVKFWVVQQNDTVEPLVFADVADARVFADVLIGKVLLHSCQRLTFQWSPDGLRAYCLEQMCYISIREMDSGGPTHEFTCPIDRIRVDPSRTHSDNYIRKLASSISDFGLFELPAVRAVLGGYLVTAGNARVLAVRTLGRSVIRVRVFNESESVGTTGRDSVQCRPER